MLRAWRTGLSRKSESGLDRPVEAMCQNVTKNSERQPERRRPRLAKHKNCRVSCRMPCRVSHSTSDSTLHSTVSLFSVCLPMSSCLITCNMQQVSRASCMYPLTVFSRSNEPVSSLLPLVYALGNRQDGQTLYSPHTRNTYLFRKGTHGVSTPYSESFLQCPANLAECPRRHVSFLTG
jgi:hypothetical protein